MLQRLLKRHNVIPRRMGLAQPIFHNYVMISGRGRIDRPTPDSFPHVIKGDKAETFEKAASPARTPKGKGGE